VIKILISIDHKWRDLPGYVYLGSLLEKEGFSVQYCRNGLEKYFIQGFKPHIVVINHLYDKRKQKYFKKVSDQGVRVVILPTEGIPTLAKYREFAAGVENDLSSVSLHLLWNEPMRKITAQNTTISLDKLKVVGVPRFDFYRSPLNKKLISRESFIEKYKLKEGLPIITFATNFTQAQFATQNKKFLEDDSKNLGYDKLFKDGKSGETIPQRDFNSRNINIKAFIKLIKEFSDVNFILKLHPSEEHTFYYKLLDNELKGYKDRVAVIVQEYIWDVLSVTDVELKRSCTTGIESWILGHPTIEMSLNADEWYYSPEHVVGSDIVTTYDDLKNTVVEYLNGKSISKSKQEKRKDFLNTWCYKVDGMSSKRAVSEIKKIRLESISITFSINFFLIYLLLKITNYKIHDIKIYGLKSLLIKNNVDKLGRIDKYYNQHDIEHWQ
jgi:surface carbohydrate biosynthesis protein